MDYQRFVSYLYEYDRGNRKQNVGFVKVDCRDEQCKVHIRWKVSPELSGEKLNVSFFFRRGAALAGILFAQKEVYGSACEVKSSLPVSFFEKYGKSLGELNGIYISCGDDSRIAFASAWDDEPVIIGGLQPAKEIILRADAGKGRDEPGSGGAEKPAEHAKKSAEAVKNVTAVATPEMSAMPETSQVPGESEVPATTWVPGKSEVPETPQTPEVPEVPQAGQFSRESDTVTVEVLSEEDHAIEKTFAENAAAEISFGGHAAAEGRSMENAAAEGRSMENAAAEISFGGHAAAEGRTEENAAAEGRSMENAAAEKGSSGDNVREASLWEKIEKNFTKFLLPTEEGYMECMRVKPHHIALLPRKYWSYGKNSFLLHGFNHYQYIIFARKNPGSGMVRGAGTAAAAGTAVAAGVEKEEYYLGVPGRNWDRERMMASMYGFTKFVPAKSRQPGFGFWCMPLEL